MLPPNRETSLLVENSKSKSCGEAMESAGIRCHQTQISITDFYRKLRLLDFEFGSITSTHKGKFE